MLSEWPIPCVSVTSSFGSSMAKLVISESNMTALRREIPFSGSDSTDHHQYGSLALSIEPRRLNAIGRNPWPAICVRPH
jgi:hypothetical protein